jgi:hypothetical protein
MAGWVVATLSEWRICPSSYGRSGSRFLGNVKRLKQDFINTLEGLDSEAGVLLWPQARSATLAIAELRKLSQTVPTDA